MTYKDKSMHVNVGSMFSFLFDSDEPNGGGAKAHKKRRLEGLRVLVVEDNKDHQELFKILLDQEGALVKIVDNGREAIETVVKSNNTDVVFMDVRMPVMSGDAAAQLLRSTGYTKPIIACTAHAMKNELENFKKRGFDEVLTKPVDAEVMINTLKKFLN